jgi:hypothetical protein
VNVLSLRSAAIHRQVSTQASRQAASALQHRTDHAHAEAGIVSTNPQGACTDMHEVQECPTESMIDRASPIMIGIEVEMEGIFKEYVDGASMCSKTFVHC